MALALIDTYTDEEFIQIVNSSTSIAEIAKKLGYSAHSGSNAVRIRKKIDELNLSTEHFNLINKRYVKRTEENIFIENSTAAQKTLREWYKKGNYTPYVCSICGQEPIWQGKELTLILDHINGSNHDDRLENLRWVCPNCNQQLETTGSKNSSRKNIVKKFYCIDCGTEVSGSERRCPKCAGKHNSIPIENMLITREELKEQIRNNSFLQIGKEYNVSDNAIRKWCIKFNLPSKKKDIKLYSDEQWKQI